MPFEYEASPPQPSFSPPASHREEETTIANTGGGGGGGGDSEGKLQGGGSVPGNSLQGASLALVGLQLAGTSTIHPAALKLLVSCGRCKSPVDMKLATPKDGTVLEITGTFSSPEEDRSNALSVPSDV